MVLTVSGNDKNPWLSLLMARTNPKFEQEEYFGHQKSKEEKHVHE
jgi:hypothetical protein